LKNVGCVGFQTIKIDEPNFIADLGQEARGGLRQWFVAQDQQMLVAVLPFIPFARKSRQD